MTRTQRNWESHRSTLEHAARRAGIEPEILIGIAGLESRFDPGARPVSSNPDLNRVTQYDGVKAMSSAHGLGQFLDGTWHEVLQRHGGRYGVAHAARLTRSQANDPVFREDIDLQAAMLAEFTRENIERARRYGVSDPAAGVYAMHNLGAGDAGRFLAVARDSPETPVREVLRARVISNNPSLYGAGDRSVAEAISAMSREMNRFSMHAKEVHQGLPSGSLTRSNPGVVSVADAMADGLLSSGEHGDAVAQLQARLAELGYSGQDGRALATDSRFGPQTRSAVERFQQDHGLRVDGVVGAQTREAMDAAREAISGRLSCPRSQIDAESPSTQTGFLQSLLQAAQSPDPQAMRSALLDLARSPTGQAFAPIQPQHPPALTGAPEQITGHDAGPSR